MYRGSASPTQCSLVLQTMFFVFQTRKTRSIRSFRPISELVQSRFSIEHISATEFRPHATRVSRTIFWTSKTPWIADDSSRCNPIAKGTAHFSRCRTARSTVVQSSRKSHATCYWQSVVFGFKKRTATGQQIDADLAQPTPCLCPATWQAERKASGHGSIGRFGFVFGFRGGVR